MVRHLVQWNRESGDGEKSGSAEKGIYRGLSFRYNRLGDRLRAECRRNSGQERAVGFDSKGFEEEGPQISGVCDGVCASAGLRDGERPCGDLFPVPAGDGRGGDSAQKAG